MALVKCPDCLNDVSNMAPSCPRCGRQIAAVTIEKTSKSIKSAQAMAVVCLLLVPVVTCGGVSAGNHGAVMFGLLLFLVGGPLFVGSAIIKWWRHD